MLDRLNLLAAVTRAQEYGVGPISNESSHGSELLMGLGLAAFLILALVAALFVVPFIIGGLGKRPRQMPPRTT